jgi:hypothetical protein
MVLLTPLPRLVRGFYLAAAKLPSLRNVALPAPPLGRQQTAPTQGCDGPLGDSTFVRGSLQDDLANASRECCREPVGWTQFAHCSEARMHSSLSEGAELSRAARHLIHNHGSRAAAVALKRAAYLHQCGEEMGADTWRKIGDLVRAIEADASPCVGKKSPASEAPAITVSSAGDIPTASPNNITEAVETSSHVPQRSTAGVPVPPSSGCSKSERTVTALGHERTADGTHSDCR